MTAHRRPGGTGGGDDELNSSVGSTRKIQPPPRHDNTFDALTKLLIQQQAKTGTLSPALAGYLVVFDASWLS
jgi:hypothetical protein